MLTVVYFDHQPFFETYEINDVVIDWNLPAEVKAMRQPERSQSPP